MTEYDITLEWPDGRQETVTVSPRETVLNEAMREGVRLPSDCRDGSCAACVGRLLAVEEAADTDGETTKTGEADETDEAGTDRSIDAARAFDYRRQPKALTASEREDGYVLLCIAMARADCRVAVGPMVRAEVGDSPW